MTIAIMSKKGQLTIPSSIRRQVNMQPGMQVEVIVRGDEVVLRPLKPLRELAGIYQEYARGKTTDYDVIREQAMIEIAKEIVGEDNA